MWAKFYSQGDPKKGNYYFPSWEECQAEASSSVPNNTISNQLRWNSVKFLKVKEDLYLNIDVYKRR
jgi:hypothetical protein